MQATIDTMFVNKKTSKSKVVNSHHDIQGIYNMYFKIDFDENQ